MKLNCYNCGQKLAIDDEVGMADIDCPTCGLPLQLASLADPAGQAVGETEEDERRKRWQDSLITTVVILILLLLFLPRGIGLGLGGAGGFLFGENGLEGEVNPQLPENLELVDGPNQSIGFLDRMFGDESENERQAGAGGTDDPSAVVGNSENATQQTMASSQAGNANDMLPESTDERSSLADDPGLMNMTLEDLPGMTNMIMLSDSFEKRLAAAGAKSGDVRISLMWNNQNDLDLHCIDPRGEELFYLHKQSRSGGVLDVDQNANAPLSLSPVENVYWPEKAAPPGVYRVLINHYRNNGGGDPTSFTVRILVRGKTHDIRGRIRFGERKKFVHQFEVPAR